MSHNLHIIAGFVMALSGLALFAGASVAYIRGTLIAGSIERRLIVLGFAIGLAAAVAHLAAHLA